MAKMMRHSSTMGNGPANCTGSGVGVWHVLLSNGNGFDLQTNWAQGHACGSTKQFLADVNGDGCADAVAWWSNGDWHVWYSDACIGHNNRFIPDNTLRI